MPLVHRTLMLIIHCVSCHFMVTIFGPAPRKQYCSVTTQTSRWLICADTLPVSGVLL